MDLAFTVSQDNDIQGIMLATSFPSTKSYENFFLSKPYGDYGEYMEKIFLKTFTPDLLMLILQWSSIVIL